MFFGLRPLTTRMQPKYAQKGLFGGKGVNFGHTVTFSNKKNKRVWYPNVQKKHFRSEILDKKITLNVTTYVLRWIDKVGGFDNYILKTPKAKLQSLLGSQLQDEMRQKLREPAEAMIKAEVDRLRLHKKTSA
eukprot:CFRG0566T1